MTSLSLITPKFSAISSDSRTNFRRQQTMFPLSARAADDVTLQAQPAPTFGMKIRQESAKNDLLKIGVPILALLALAVAIVLGSSSKGDTTTTPQGKSFFERLMSGDFGQQPDQTGNK